MLQPPGVTSSDKGIVCRLNKATYGLKQAPRSCSYKQSQTLYQMGFHSAKSDTSLFIRLTKSSTILILIHVDNIIIIGSSKLEICVIISPLHRLFSLKDVIYITSL